jgi:hypothetical protein
MMWKAKAFRYNNREIPKDAAQRSRPPRGNWTFYEAIKQKKLLRTVVRNSL